MDIISENFNKMIKIIFFYGRHFETCYYIVLTCSHSINNDKIQQYDEFYKDIFLQY